MPLPSCFAPCGLFELSSDDPTAEKLYRAELISKGSSAKSPPFDLTIGTHIEASCYARAMGKAEALATVQRAGNQGDTSKAYECLPNLEDDFLVRPSPGETVYQRQQVLTAKRHLSGGARQNNVVSALRALLGTDFLAYKPMKASDLVSLTPALPLLSNLTHATDVRIQARIVRFLDPVVVVGLDVDVPYENWDTTAEDVFLISGESVMVDVENSGRRERVDGIAAYVDASGQRFMTTTFANPHDMRCSATTGHWPLQIGVARFSYIIVNNASAIDAVTRTKIDSLMAQLARGVSTWAIVQPTTPGALTIGPFLYNATPLGCAPFEQTSFTLSP